MRRAAVLAMWAVLLLAPSLVFGTIATHSSPQNLLWAEQFAELVRAGQAYPRWLPHSFEGLGAPVFYFYGPLPFWIDAAVRIVTANALDVAYRLGLTSIILLWASGLAMASWLSALDVRERHVRLGAMLYMAAPYHLLNHYVRGAFGEFTAIALIPVLALSLRRIADGRRAAVPMTAVAYAALLCAHLPTALLVTVVMLPVYLWCLTPARRVRLVPIACSGVLGLGLAAIYVGPALGLRPFIRSERWLLPGLRPQEWLVLWPQRWVDALMMGIVSSLAAAYLLITVALWVASHRNPRSIPGQEQKIWLAVGLLAIAMMAGLVPPIWQAPYMANIQFPWRLLSVVEFAVITALVLLPGRWAVWPPDRLVLVTILLLTPAVAMIGGSAQMRVMHTARHRPLERMEATEYEPAGFPSSHSGRQDDPGLDMLAGTPLIRCTPVPADCRAASSATGAMRLQVEAERPTQVTVRRFMFPSWAVQDVASGRRFPLSASEPWRLVSFQVPAGRHDLALTQDVPPVVRRSGFISAAALLLLLLLCGVDAWPSRRPTRSTTRLTAPAPSATPR